MIFERITKIVIVEGPITIDADGLIVGATVVKQEGNVLTIGDENSNGSISFCNVGGFTSFGNNSSITSSGTMLTGSRTQRITINGRQTTYGQIMDWVDGVKTIAEPKKEIPVYQLGASCEINVIECVGSADLNQIGESWLSEGLTVTISGSGDVHLPAKSFKNLSVTISGSGEVIGDGTETDYVSISVAGSGDVKGLHVCESGSVTVAGSGDVNLTAQYPNRVTRSVCGSGDVRVRSNSKRIKT